jgi:hypothetical protein
VFSVSPSSENQTDGSLSSVTFKQAGKEPARELTIEYLDGNGLGLSCDIERPSAALFSLIFLAAESGITQFVAPGMHSENLRWLGCISCLDQVVGRCGDQIAAAIAH